MLEPKLILLDEPAGGINPSLLGRIVEIIRDLNRQGITFLVVEHNIPMVLDLCDPVVVFCRGQAIARGPAADRPRRPGRARRLPRRRVAARRAGPGAVLDQPALSAKGELTDADRSPASSPATAAATCCRASTSRCRRGAITCIVGPERRRQVDRAAGGQRPAHAARWAPIDARRRPRLDQLGCRRRPARRASPRCRSRRRCSRR